MSLRLYLDHHVPVAIAEALERRGVDVLTAADDGTADWEDEDILQRATDLQRAVFTQDRDFLAIAHRWYQDGRPFSGLIYAHQLRITIGQAVADLELIAGVSDPDDMRNRIEFLPL